MLFSSITFIYLFLPILFLVYFLTPNKYRNIPLLIFSLLFYFLGEPKYILVLLFSCTINYILSVLIGKNKKPKLFLIISLIYNIGNLLYFKYTDFFISNINNIFHLNLDLLHIVMPIGISFYTFQIIAYMVDVYKGIHKPAKNIFTFTTYVALFPQLIAGPIVRYRDIEDELENRKHTFENFANGIKRFIIGLGKKVLIANVLGEVATQLLTETVLSSWLKPIIFTLQIYYDFSGYSDMAIGLGLMLGFHFLENFNYPLISKSITDFWRRWHISLSSFFRDYVYIPLGGNRCGTLKHIRNIIIVWFLTGFWHGASWNFILWGLFFVVFLILEKYVYGKQLEKTKVFKYIYTILIIVISFLIFNTTNLSEIVTSLKNMFFINKILIIIAIIGATPLPKNIIKKLKTTKYSKVIDVLEPIFYIVLLTLVTAFLIDASFNPFLYFRF